METSRRNIEGGSIELKFSIGRQMELPASFDHSLFLWSQTHKKADVNLRL